MQFSRNNALEKVVLSHTHFKMMKSLEMGLHECDRTQCDDCCDSFHVTVIGGMSLIVKIMTETVLFMPPLVLQETVGAGTGGCRN